MSAAVANAASNLKPSSKRLAEMFARRSRPGMDPPEDCTECSRQIVGEWLDSSDEAELQAIAAKKFSASEFEL